MHWAGHTHGSVIARCIAFIMGPWMGYWYITHKHTYNCIFFLLFSATFNAALKQNGLRLTQRNHMVLSFLEILTKSSKLDILYGFHDRSKKKNTTSYTHTVDSIVSEGAFSPSINAKLQQTIISSSKMNPPVSIYSLTDMPFWKSLQSDITLEIETTISLSRKLLLNLELNNWKPCSNSTRRKKVELCFTVTLKPMTFWSWAAQMVWVLLDGTLLSFVYEPYQARSCKAIWKRMQFTLIW